MESKTSIAINRLSKKYIDKIANLLIFDEPCIILPEYGEFGWFIMRYIRLCHIIKCPYKIVCCKKGEEIYFPTANEFYHKWEDQPDSYKHGWRDISVFSRKTKANLIEILKRKYPNFILIDLSNTIWEDTYNVVQQCKFQQLLEDLLLKESLTLENIFSTITFPLSYFKQNLDVDIVIGARKRMRRLQRNWTLWNDLSDSLIKNNISFAVIGLKETTFKVNGALYYSWDFEKQIDAMVELLYKCKIFVGTDTGTFHFANFIQKPILLFGGAGQASMDYMCDMKNVTMSKSRNNINIMQNEILELLRTYDNKK